MQFIHIEAKETDNFWESCPSFFSEKERKMFENEQKNGVDRALFEVIYEEARSKNEVAVFAASRPADASVWIYRSRWYG